MAMMALLKINLALQGLDLEFLYFCLREAICLWVERHEHIFLKAAFVWVYMWAYKEELGWEWKVGGTGPKSSRGVAPGYFLRFHSTKKHTGEGDVNTTVIIHIHT